jgi:hypothetical protein
MQIAREFFSGIFSCKWNSFRSALSQTYPRSILVMKPVVLFFLVFALCSPAAAQSVESGVNADPVLPGGRRALVVGIGEYKGRNYTAPLENARLMADALREKGFKVFHSENLSVKSFKIAVKLFASSLNASAAVVYVAGHSVRHEGRIYLVPAGATIEKASDIPFECIDLGLITERIDRNPMNLVLLETGTNRAFQALWPEYNTPGPVVYPAMENTLVITAVDLGQAIGKPEFIQGAFTRELINQMQTPGERAHAALLRTAAEVEIASSGLQKPVISGQAVAFFKFSPALPPAEMAAGELAKKRGVPD